MRAVWVACGMVTSCCLAFLGPPAVAAQNVGGANEDRYAQRSSDAASIHWDGVPLRDALARAAQVYGTTVFLDRRVDPHLRVSLRAEAAPLDEVLQIVSDKLSLGTTRLDELRYVGPNKSAEQLRTIIAWHDQRAESLPMALQLTMQREATLAWPRLSEPRRLISDVARQRGWSVAHEDRVPHDLWPAGTLSASTGIEQLALLLVSFDLTFVPHPERRTLELVPLKPVSIQRRYRLTNNFKSHLDRLREEQPTASVHIDGNTLVLDGRIEDHEFWAMLSQGRRAQPRTERRTQGAKQAYTLRVEQQPVDAIVRQLAERLDWNIVVDEAAIRAAGKSLSTRVTFAVENCDQDELLEAVLRPAGLDFRRDGTSITIVPIEADE